MKDLILGVTRFLKDEEGVTAIEYGLIASLIAVVIIAAVTLIGTELRDTFSCIAVYLQTGAAGPTCPGYVAPSG